MSLPYFGMLRFLLARGKNVNARGDDGNTPLMVVLDTDFVYSR